MLLLLAVASVCWCGSATACSDGLYPCLKSDMAQALARISRSESVRLLPGLSLDRNPASDPPSSVLKPGLPYPTNVTISELYSSAERLFKSHSLYWNLIPGVDLRVSSDDQGDFQLGVARCHHRQERTFKFGMRRMKMMLLPVMYKLGVITTLLTLLTVFALKGLTIGVLLLIMSTAGLVAKFKWHHPGGGHGWPSNGKEVHVHLHGGHQGGGGPIYHSHPAVHYDDWVREDRPGSYEEQQVQQRPSVGWGSSAGEVVQRPGVLQQPSSHHRIVHRLPAESTPSPWANYIGDQAL